VVFNLDKILRNLITTPSAPKRRLRDIFLRSRLPLLGEPSERRGKFVTRPFGQHPRQAVVKVTENGEPQSRSWDASLMNPRPGRPWLSSYAAPRQKPKEINQG
jgi:hypothetical protein